MTTWIISAVLGFGAGGAVIWFFKDPLLKWYKGAEDYAGYLNDKIQKLKQ